MNDKLLSTGECAFLLGVSRQAITAAIARGEIPATKAGRNYVVKESDCMTYQPKIDPVERGRLGGPKPKVTEEKPKRGRGRPRKQG